MFARSSLLACALFASALAIPASAAEEVSRTPYQAMKTRSCVSSPCDIEYLTVGVNRRLEVSYVSCQTATPYGSKPLDAAVTTNDDKISMVMTPIPGDHDFSGNTVRRWSQPIFMFVPEGVRLRLRTWSTDKFTGTTSCSIAGHVVTLQ